MVFDGANRVQKRRSDGSRLSSRLSAGKVASPTTAKPTTVGKSSTSIWQDHGRTEKLKASYQSVLSEARSNGAQSYQRQSPAGARNRPRGTQPLRSAAPPIMAPSVSPSTFANMKITSGTPNDPSVAPNPSIALGNAPPSRAPTLASQQTYHGALRNQICILSGFTSANFSLGDVISAPFHQPNLVPNCDPNDFRLKVTCEGPVYSKRRMLVVLMIFESSLFCLPLYSFGGRGLAAKPPHVKKEYVALKNVQHDKIFGGRPFANAGLYPPVEANVVGNITESTTFHIAGGVKVDCKGDVNRIDRITEGSYSRLLGLWDQLNQSGQRLNW